MVEKANGSGIMDTPGMSDPHATAANSTADDLRAKIDDRSAKISFLQEMTAILVDVSSMQELFEAIASKAQESLPYEICSTHLVNLEEKTVSVMLAHAPVEAKWRGRSLPLGKGIVGIAAETGELINVPDTRNDPRWIESIADIRSELAVPIASQGRVVAVLNLESTSPNAFTTYDEQIFSILAAQIGAGLERFVLHRETAERANRLQALNRLAREIAAEPDVDRIFEVVADEINFVVNADRVALSLYDPLQDELEIIGAQGLGIDKIGIGYRYSVHDALPQAEGPVVRWAMDENHSLKILESSGIRVIMTVPIRLDDVFVAELNLGFTDRIRLPDSPQVEFLWALASHLSVVLKSARLYRELRKSSQDLRDTQHKLLQSAKLSAVGELAAGVAHELNNPLTGILGYTQFCLMAMKARLKDGMGPDEVAPLAERMEKIEREVLRCKDIVQNLLNFSRAHDRTPFTLLSLNDVVKATLSVMEHQLNTHQIKADVQLDKEIPAVRGNANQLQQVFTNILINAQKAMRDDGELQIRTGFGEGQVWAKFTDNGPGIPLNIQQKIFDPFFTTRKVGEGTGLGLSVSYGLVTDHGGTITVDSEPNNGATFTVSLPAIIAPSDQ